MNKLAAFVAASALAVVLTSCSVSANSTACKLYEDAYNQMADAVRMVGEGVLERESAIAANDLVPARIADAYEKANGDVAVAMRSSLELAEANAALNTEDAGVAWFMSTTEVADACAADGAPITFNEMSSK